MPNILPLLLPWLAVLVLLALPSNRNQRAWWIWAPLIGLAMLGAGLETATEGLYDGGLNFSIQAACAAAFGLAAIWLLGSALARRCRALAIAIMAPAFAAVSLLALVVSPVYEQLSGLNRWEPEVFLYLLLFWVVGGLVFAGALNLTGRLCRRGFSRARVWRWLLLWLWAMWLATAVLVSCMAKLISGDSIEWSALLVAPIILALVSFATALPFLILSFTNAFYRERLERILRLPIAAAPPPTPLPAAAVELASQ